MTMTPIPILCLLLHLEFHKWMVLTVSLAQIYAIRTIFVVVPVVVVLVLTVINPVAVIVVSMVFFLTSVVFRNSWLAPVSVGYRGKDVPLCARFSTKSDSTVNCAFLSSWVHASTTLASRCTNRTQSGRHRCDGKLLERTCPRSNCISTCVRFNLDSIWGIHDLGRVRVNEGRIHEHSPI